MSGGPREEAAKVGQMKDVSALMKRGKSLGTSDPLYVLAAAVYELQGEVKRLKERLESHSHFTEQTRIGGSDDC